MDVVVGTMDGNPASMSPPCPQRPDVVLVTGGTGLVGRALQAVVTENPCFEEDWVFAGSRDADLTSYTSAAQLFDNVQPTRVLHLAARVGGLYANVNDNVGFWRQNIAMQVMSGRQRPKQ